MNEEKNEESCARLSFAELRSRFSQREQPLPPSGRVVKNPPVPDCCLKGNTVCRPRYGVNDAGRHNAQPPADCSETTIETGSSQPPIAAQTANINLRHEVSQAESRPPVPPKTKRPLPGTSSAASEKISNLVIPSRPPPVPPKVTRPRPLALECSSVNEFYLRSQRCLGQTEFASGTEHLKNPLPGKDEIKLTAAPSTTLQAINKPGTSSKEVVTHKESDCKGLFSSVATSETCTPDLPVSFKTTVSHDCSAQKDTDGVGPLELSTKSSLPVRDVSSLPVTSSATLQSSGLNTDIISNCSYPRKQDKTPARILPEDSLPLLEYDSLDIDQQTTPQSQGTTVSMEDSGDFSANSSTASSLEPFGYEQFCPDTFVEDCDFDSRQLPPPPPLLSEADYFSSESDISLNLPLSPISHIWLPQAQAGQQYDLPEFREFRPMFYNESLVVSMCERIARVGRRRRRQDAGARGTHSEEQRDSLVRSLTIDSDDLCLCRQVTGDNKSDSGSSREADSEDYQPGNDLEAIQSYNDRDLEPNLATSQSSSQAFSPIGPGPLIGCHDDYLVHSDLESDVPVSSHDIELTIPSPELGDTDASDEDDDEGMESSVSDITHSGASVLNRRHHAAYSQCQTGIDNVWGYQTPHDLLQTSCFAPVKQNVSETTTLNILPHDQSLNTDEIYDPSLHCTGGENYTVLSQETESEPEISPFMMSSPPRTTNSETSGKTSDPTVIGADAKDDDLAKPDEMCSDSETVADLTPPDGLIFGDDCLGENNVSLECENNRSSACDRHEDPLSECPDVGSSSASKSALESTTATRLQLQNSDRGRAPALSKDPSADSTVSSDYLDNCSADLSSSDCGYSQGHYGGSRSESMMGELGSPPGSVTSEYVAAEAASSSTGDIERRTSLGIILLNNDVGGNSEISRKKSGTFSISEHVEERDVTQMMPEVRGDFPSPPLSIENGFGFNYEDDDHTEDDRFDNYGVNRRVKETSFRTTDSDARETGDTGNTVISDAASSKPQKIRNQESDSDESESESESEKSQSSLEGEVVSPYQQIDESLENVPEFYTKSCFPYAAAIMSEENPLNSSLGEEDRVASVEKMATSQEDYIDKLIKPDIKEQETAAGGDTPGNTNHVSDMPNIVENTADPMASGNGPLKEAQSLSEFIPDSSTTVTIPTSAADIVITGCTDNKATAHTVNAGNRKKKRPLRSGKRVSFRLRQDR